MAYLIDANVFIRAKNLEYGFDFCPAFWDWLMEQNAGGTVFSIEKVGEELRAGDDELAQWAKDRGPSFFVPPAPNVASAFADVSAWVMSGRYEPSATSIFLQTADYYLVAQALAGGHVVVSHEVPSAGTKRIKIPDVCLGLRINCMKPYEVLRLERARFVLGRSA